MELIFVCPLNEIGPGRWRLVFVNNGVNLAIEGAGLLADLQRRRP
jgi:hypothetical protein